MRINLNKKIVEDLKEVFTEKNLIWKNSSYGGRRFGFLIPDKWIETFELLSSYNYDVAIIEYTKFICSCHPIPKEYIKKNNVTDAHIILIRNSYFYYNDNYLFLDFKKPFGNSSPMYDVLRAFQIPYIDDSGKMLNINWEAEYGYLLDDAIIKIKDFLINMIFDEDLEGVSHFLKYELTDAYLRKNKIKNLLKQETYL